MGFDEAAQGRSLSSKGGESHAPPAVGLPLLETEERGLLCTVWVDLVDTAAVVEAAADADEAAFSSYNRRGSKDSQLR